MNKGDVFFFFPQIEISIKRAEPNKHITKPNKRPKKRKSPAGPKAHLRHLISTKKPRRRADTRYGSDDAPLRHTTRKTHLRLTREYRKPHNPHIATANAFHFR